MNSKTLYSLIVTEKINGGYEVWETHTCQEKGCIQTQPALINFVQTKEEVQAIIDDWKLNPPLNGVLSDVEWEEQPKLPTIHQDDADTTHGTYADYPELILAICELSGLKPYRVIDDTGRLQYFTFEVVE